VLSVSQLQQLRDVLICCRYDISKPPFPRLSILNETRGLCIKSEKLSIGVFKISEISGRCLWVPIAALVEEVSRTPRYPFSGGADRGRGVNSFRGHIRASEGGSSTPHCKYCTAPRPSNFIDRLYEGTRDVTGERAEDLLSKYLPHLANPINHVRLVL
jgi:hypothetical protein